MVILQEKIIKLKPEDFFLKVQYYLGDHLSIISLQAFPNGMGSAQTSDFFAL